MKTKKHPRDLGDLDVEAMVATFDDNADDAYSVTDSATLANCAPPPQPGAKPKAASRLLPSPPTAPGCRGA